MLSPTTSSYWAGRMWCWTTLAGGGGREKCEKKVKPQHSVKGHGLGLRWRGNLPSSGASCMMPCVSQKVSRGLWLYSLAWALKCTFKVLGTFCLLTAFTVNLMGSPATGALSSVRRSATASEERSEEPVNQASRVNWCVLKENGASHVKVIIYRRKKTEITSW